MSVFAAWTRSSPQYRASLIYILFIGLFFIYAYTHSYNDPTSLFFRTSAATQPQYSAFRQKQAREYIESARHHEQIKVANGTAPFLCVGMASVAREGTRYFKDAVGSVLHGLDERERRRVHLILFLAHTDQSRHPAYSEGWIPNVADTVLTYDLPPAQLDHVKQMEAEAGLFREKGLFDYIYMLRACQKTGAEYVTVIEDDVLAMDGWLYRTVYGLELANKKTRKMESDQFLYMRLFYTETYLGWNSEEWIWYLSSSLVAFVSVAITLLILRCSFRKNKSVSPYLSRDMFILYLFFFTPILILLVFATGRVTMFPMFSGVNLMPKFGCCSQALLFQRKRIKELTAWLEERRVGFVDELIEEFASRFSEFRWALTPSVFQHIGSQSSKSDQGVVTNWIFNYNFETYNPLRLHAQHEHALNRTA